jgi:hypothetical protein
MPVFLPDLPDLPVIPHAPECGAGVSGFRRVGVSGTLFYTATPPLRHPVTFSPWRRAFVVSVGNLASKLPDSCVQSSAIITSMIAVKLVLDSSVFQLTTAKSGYLVHTVGVTEVIIN